MTQSHLELVERIRDESMRSREAYQVVRRMKELFPHSLHSLKGAHRSGNTASKAERIAKNDPEYLIMIDEYIAVFHKGLEARIQWETHRMLLHARQSNRSYRQAQKFS